jgi:hypothetical protein
MSESRGLGGAPSALEAALPDFGWREYHETTIAAPPERVRDALLSLEISDLRLTAFLVAIRTLPTLLTGRRPLGAGAGTLLEELGSAGFVVLRDSESELVLGVVGRFWGLRATPLRLAGVQAFEEFAEPGYARAVWNFRFEPLENGTRLSTETRIQATDAAARRAFGRYWRIIQPGSGLIRREMLAAVRRRAERRG